MFSKATKLVHHWLRQHIQSGDLVVDATCGNGHDTVFLAECVGPNGKVIAVDIQESAIQATRTLLTSRNLLSRVRLRHMSHEHAAEALLPEESVMCAVFNLGYLPGGDKQIITMPATSLPAHQNLLRRLAPGGAIISTIYTGHSGGQLEAEALLEWSKGLDGKQFSVARHEWINQEGMPPFILIVQRRPGRMAKTGFQGQ